MRVPVKSAISFFAHADEKRKCAGRIDIVSTVVCTSAIYPLRGGKKNSTQTDSRLTKMYRVTRLTCSTLKGEI